jgi:hypothetical protein
MAQKMAPLSTTLDQPPAERSLLWSLLARLRALLRRRRAPNAAVRRLY